MSSEEWLSLGRPLLRLLLTVAFYVALLLPFALWCAWWLWGVNWRKCWPALAKGAWMPLLLLAGMAALVWTKLQPVDYNCSVCGTLPNGWWQMGAVAGLLAVALFCGWLQGYFGWTPQEISVEPPAHAHGHDHGHGHAHH